MSETDERRSKNFWKFFIPNLTKDVSDLPAAGPGGSCWVANSLCNIQGIEEGRAGLGQRELETLRGFVSKWREQDAYPKRLGEEAEELSKSSRKWAGFLKRGILMEEFQNLIGIREMMGQLKKEMEEFFPERAKQFREELAALDKELKEKTVPLPKGHIQSDKPWYENRWPVYEAENYKQKEKK